MARTGLLDFTKVRHAISFADLLAHYDLGNAKPGQKQVKINCPFHEDQTPSCSINVEKGLFNCFGCPAEGNVLDFIAQMEGYTDNAVFKAAKHALTIIGGSPADFQKDGTAAERPQNARRASKPSNRMRRSTKAQKTAEAASEDASEPAEPTPEVTANPVISVRLTLDPEHPALAERGVGRSLAEQFGLGYCAKGIMRNRIAIPLHNAEGELVAYIGRWAKEEPPPKNEPRYKLPKDFHKALELFNLHRAIAMHHTLGKRYVVVVEGIWSVLRLHAAGVPAVALLGTSCSDTQAAKLAAAGFRYAILILDGDEAGHLAAPSVAHVLSQHVYVKTLVLPDGVKPDTMDESIVSRLCR